MANANGWGDGSVNNNIGWGQGANNTIGWGKSQLDSWSGATDIDGGNLPSNSVAPAITGTAQEGQTLTCSTGTWSGSPTYTYQWKRNGNNIGGATSSTYLLVLADVGQNILCTVTATNFVGSATADSNTVVPIAIANLLLDTYTNATVAYSLRKLRTAYSGSAIRVRRSSDNAEQDIAFSGDDLDTASLLTFCGAGNGFITTWYDQSTNANNSTQATAANQAQIVSSGALILDVDTSKITTTWSNDRYTLTTGISVNTKYLSVSAFRRQNINQNLVHLGSSSAFNPTPLLWRDNTDANRVRSFMNTNLIVDTVATLGRCIITSLKNNSNLKVCYRNATQLTTTATEAPATGTLNVFGQSSATIFTSGQYQEYIYWDSEQSANRTGIETNLNTYWNAY